MKELTKDKELFSVLKAIALTSPQDEVMLRKIFMHVQATQMYAESEALHLEIIERVPYSSQAWYNLGYAQKHLGNIEGALFALEYAVICNPDWEQALIDYGSLAIQNHRYQAFIIFAQPYLVHARLSNDLLFLFAQAFIGLGSASAFGLMKRLLELDPQNSSAWIALIKYLLQENKVKQALEYIDKAMSYHSDAVFLLFRGICLLKMGMKERAFYWIGEAVEDGFEDIDLLLTLSPESAQDRYMKLIFGNKF